MKKFSIFEYQDKPQQLPADLYLAQKNGEGIYFENEDIFLESSSSVEESVKIASIMSYLVLNKKHHDNYLSYIEHLASSRKADASSKYVNPRYDKQYLYKLTFPDDMVYIGTAFDISKRWANKGAGYRGQPVWKAISKYGWDNIKKEVIMYMPIEDQKGDEVRKKELELIHQYEGRCYNCQGDASFHAKVAEKTRQNGYGGPRIFWTINGETKAARDWCAELGVCYSKITRRMNDYDLTLDQALALPDVPPNRTREPILFWKEQGYEVHKKENSCRA